AAQRVSGSNDRDFRIDVVGNSRCRSGWRDLGVPFAWRLDPELGRQLVVGRAGNVIETKLLEGRAEHAAAPASSSLEVSALRRHLAGLSSRVNATHGIVLSPRGAGETQILAGGPGNAIRAKSPVNAGVPRHPAIANPTPIAGFTERSNIQAFTPDIGVPS